MSKGIFITGTGTDVGKTYVTGLLLKKMIEAGMDSTYYKAAVSGNVRDKNGKLIPGDIAHVAGIADIKEPLENMVPYIYENAVSPHLASRLEGNPVCMDVVKEYYERLAGRHDYIVMEGSGGILCPICFDEKEIWLEDIIKEFHLPSLIIAEAGLGTINNVILTAHYMNQKKLPVKGIILNHFHEGNIMEEDNLKMIEFKTGIPVIACVKDNAQDMNMEQDKLIDLFA
ncbi:MAG: dethiobiotin synthase [Anaerocolumna sp.]